MIEKRFQKEVLLQASEDWSGLWEAAWGIRTLDPALSTDTAVAIAKTILKDFLSRDFIYVCRLKDGEEIRFDAGESRSILESVSWEAAQNEDNQFWFASTKKGDKALREMYAEAKR